VMALKDLNYFLRLPGRYPVTQLQLKLLQRKKAHLGFIERTVLLDDPLRQVFSDKGKVEETATQQEGMEGIKKEQTEVQFDV